VSGCTDYDYPKEGLGIPSIAPLKSRHKIPLPGALLEQWNGIVFSFYLLFVILLDYHLLPLIFSLFSAFTSLWQLNWS